MIGLFVALFLSKAVLLGAYGHFIVDSPVHYKQIIRPHQKIHRKGVNLVYDREYHVQFSLWGIDPEQADDWKICAEMDAPDDLESLYLTRAANWHHYGTVVLLPGKGSAGGFKALVVNSEEQDELAAEAYEETHDDRGPGL
jgi:hypothetical protein